MPFSRARSNISSMTLAPVSWSRLPVGSSASISAACHHGAGEADALLLAARKRARQVGQAVAEADFVERRGGAVADCSPGLAGLGDLERQRDVLERRHRGDEVEVLEQDAEAVAAEDRQLVLVELAGDVRCRRRRPCRWWPARGRPAPSAARSCRCPRGRRRLRPRRRIDVEADILEDVQRRRARLQVKVHRVGGNDEFSHALFALLYDWNDEVKCAAQE